MNEQMTSNTECNGGTCQADLVTIRPTYRSSESGEGVDLQILLPGVKNDGVELSAEGIILRIQAKRSDSVPEAWSVRQATPRPDAYELRIRLHASLDATKTSAKLADGILQVEISKREEAKPRRIKLS